MEEVKLVESGNRIISRIKNLKQKKTYEKFIEF